MKSSLKDCSLKPSTLDNVLLTPDKGYSQKYAYLLQWFVCRDGVSAAMLSDILVFNVGNEDRIEDLFSIFFKLHMFGVGDECLHTLVLLDSWIFDGQLTLLVTCVSGVSVCRIGPLSD